MCSTTAIIMTYRQKTCPYCSTQHKKRGPYCSKSCSNRGRTITETQKANMSHAQAKSHANREKTPGEWEVLTRNQLAARNKTLPKHEELLTDPNDIYLEPMKPALPVNQFVASGDLWTEKD